MKNQLVKNLLIELSIIIFSLIQMIFAKNANMYLILAVLLVLNIAVYFLNKSSIKKSIFTKDTMLVVLVGILSYYVITYFIGFFIGFIYSNYSRSITGILFNLITNIGLILLIEQLRYDVIADGKYYKSVVILSIITFTFAESVTFLSFNNMSRVSVLEILLGNVLPCLSLNVLLSFLTYKTGKVNSIITHLLMSIPNFLLPVFPNLGDYFRTLILVALPLILVSIIYSMFIEKNEVIKDTRAYLKKLKIKKYVSIAIILLLVSFLYLVSGVGRYSVYAIGSGSMQGVINKGDVVVIDKKPKNKYKVKDVIAFKMDNKIIVHRINDIKYVDDKAFYITKGDANNGVDDCLINDDDIVGLYTFRFRGLGWPTIYLSELISR